MAEMENNFEAKERDNEVPNPVVISLPVSAATDEAKKLGLKESLSINLDNERDDTDERDSDSFKNQSGKKKVRFDTPIQRSESADSEFDVGSAQTDATVENFVIRSNNTLLSMDTTYSMPGYARSSRKSSLKHENSYASLAEKIKFLIEPEVDNEVSAFSATKEKVVEGAKMVDSEFSKILAKIVILQSRSSGVDKTASFFQYAAMFCGDVFTRYARAWQAHYIDGNFSRWMMLSSFFSKVKPLKSNETRWWYLLEDSMSSGRKVLRLFKWFKEIERARLALTVPSEFLGHARTGLVRVLTRVITVISHFFAGIYYFFDNLVWANQIGLVNSTVRTKERELLRLYKRDIKFEEYKDYQNVYSDYLKSRKASTETNEKWQNIRNFASLYRLVASLLNAGLRLNSLKVELERLQKKYEYRLAISEIVHESKEKSTTTLLDELKSQIDSMHVKTQDKMNDLLSIKSPELLVKERDSRFKEIMMQREDQIDEAIASACNLVMTLSRLKFKYFEHLPLYVIGALGMVAGFIGIQKNWPKQVPTKK